MAAMASITFTFDLPARFLDDRAERTGFVLLGAFLLAFLFIRTSARLIRSPRVPWWPGSVTTGSGLHLHHLVWGIVLLLVTGFLGFAVNPASPWEEILAGGFGIGAGLTLDEFALWIYLRDVYWAEEGRASLDAVVVAASLGGLIVLGIAPFDLPHNGSSVTTLVATVLAVTVLSAGAILKGRHYVGLIGIFVPIASLAVVCRLAAPGSPWARRFYTPDGSKLAKARARFARAGRRRRRLADAISGAPSSASSASDEERQLESASAENRPEGSDS
jgi:hypothetical protein